MFFEFLTKKNEIISIAADKILFVAKKVDGSCYISDVIGNLYLCKETYDVIMIKLNAFKLLN